MQIDLTPYNYSWNNPTNINDPDGECPSCLWGAAIGALVEYGSQVVVNAVEGKGLVESLTDVDGGKILTSTITGAATGGLSSLKVIGATAKVYKTIAMSSTVAAGNMSKQYQDGNKTVDPTELAVEVATENLPIPKVKVPKVSKKAIKTAERQLDRAERINRSNSRPSRQNAVKESKEKLDGLNKQNKNAETAEKAVNETKDATTKEVIKKQMEENP